MLQRQNKSERRTQEPLKHKQTYAIAIAIAGNGKVESKETIREARRADQKRVTREKT